MRVSNFYQQLYDNIPPEKNFQSSITHATTYNCVLAIGFYIVKFNYVVMLLHVQCNSRGVEHLCEFSLGSG